MIRIFMAAQTYLVDAHPRHAASASAANAVLRSVAGALLPMCGLDVYDALVCGVGETVFLDSFFGQWHHFRLLSSCTGTVSENSTYESYRIIGIVPSRSV